jgi:hypothetical protein
MAAAANGHPETVALLIKLCADLDAQHTDGG